MTPPEFSVLLLAWDDADPGVAVLGGAALPPTLALVYRLAAQQPVLAVYPHLPAEAATAPAAENGTPAAGQPASPGSGPAATNPAAAATPGVRVLPGAAAPKNTKGPAVPRQLSRMVGLDDLAASSPLLAATSGLRAGVSATPPAAPARSQWPAGTGEPTPGQWPVPAAPYVGASADERLPAPAAQPDSSRRSESGPRAAAGLPLAPARPVPASGAYVATRLRPTEHPLAGDLNFDPDPELPTPQVPPVFDEVVEEPGPAEALALLAPEDDLTPNAAPARAPKANAANASAPQPVVAMPALDGLNFRMIQYARRAAQLVRGRSDFGVIYAPNWPAWLAALEIRNRTGQPLVLYAAGLAADFSSPAERGWLLEVERMTLRRAHLIVVPSEDVRRRMQQQYGATIGAIRVVAAADEDALRRVLGEAAAGRAAC
ncbi:glycosyltransferase [Hymenobacter sp.]|uniref:glycosyltransferase n=1 Tax=Hymenobacter sp. TaxID=1898978 RepID=UPI00286C49A0|nr:glycosyltransferase [Hymenobacter sp.]